MNRRRLLLIAAIWVVTVVTASSATWAVISATGTRVGQAVPLSAPPSVTSTHTAVPPSASTTPTAAPTIAPTKPSSSKPSHTRPAPSESDHGGDEPTYAGSWSGEAGTVSASCTGATISLVSAVPAVGYRAHADGSGTRQLEVEFESSQGEDHEAHVKAWCEDGKPTFRRD